MELRTEKLIEKIKQKYPTLSTEQVISMVMAEALLKMSDDGIYLYLNYCEHIPVEPLEVRICNP